ncbi:MAG: substrate-binding domain-containing protein [Paracoccaceae bacterium]
MRKILAILLLCAQPVWAKADVIKLASTTSTDHSGLFEFILPQFTAQTGISVRVIAVGTGQALRIARSGDADVLLVHHRASEDAFINEGYGIARRDVMFNQFVIIGPLSDPAGVKDAQTAAEALTLIAQSQSKFASRGDNSGTHLRELELWQAAGITPKGGWYQEIGSGMGTTLNFASAADAYTISDDGTWTTFHNHGDLVQLFAGDETLFNPYGIILVNPERYAHVNYQSARIFSDWLTSPAGQEAIGAFIVDGKLAFCPHSPSDARQKSQEYQKTCAANAP